MLAPASGPRAHADAFVELQKVTHTYGRGDKEVRALESTDLRIEKGDFIALVGPSGCGKSTILKLVTGLINASSGVVFVAGREVTAEPVRIGMAFQNVMLPLKIVAPFRQEYRAKRRSEFRDRVDALLAQVGLAGFADKYPWQLSGGMMQRASLCRALVHEPQLLMLDEPFGALDQFTREELWGIMQELWMPRRPTVLLVTHDLKEAAYLANRICVMQARPGRIIQESMVGFARPRTIALSYDPEFVTLTQRLRELIMRPTKETVESARSCAGASLRPRSSSASSWRGSCSASRSASRTLSCRGRARSSLRWHSACRRFGRTRCRPSIPRWSASPSASLPACFSAPWSAHRSLPTTWHIRCSSASRAFRRSPSFRSSFSGSAPALFRPC